MMCTSGCTTSASPRRCLAAASAIASSSSSRPSATFRRGPRAGSSFTFSRCAATARPGPPRPPASPASLASPASPALGLGRTGAAAAADRGAWAWAGASVQEGRGIGILNKTKAYRLQQHGYDTVDANRALGLPDDCREYDCVSDILNAFKIRSIALMTNNPRKISLLSGIGVQISSRVPCVVDSALVPVQARGYLQAKAERMGHLLVSPERAVMHDGHGHDVLTVQEGGQEAMVQMLAHLQACKEEHDREAEGAAPSAAESAAPALPRKSFVTLTYAQSLDGGIALQSQPGAEPQAPLCLSGAASMGMTHALRHLHEGIVVGIQTILADDPELTVRLAADGTSIPNVRPPSQQPVAVVLDSSLRLPPGSKLVAASKAGRRVIAVTVGQPFGVTGAAVVTPEMVQAAEQQGDDDGTRAMRGRCAKLLAAGVVVLAVGSTDRGREGSVVVSVPKMICALREHLGIASIMVEGGAYVIESFLEAAHNDEARGSMVDFLVVTVSPKLFLGKGAVQPQPVSVLDLSERHLGDAPPTFLLGGDIVVYSGAADARTGGGARITEVPDHAPTYPPKL